MSDTIVVGSKFEELSRFINENKKMKNEQIINLGDTKPVITLGGFDNNYFKPNANFSFYNDEFFFNLNDEEKIITTETASVENFKTVLGGKNSDVFHIDEDGNFKWDKVFTAKPESNKIRWKIKCSEGITFEYQPLELTPLEISRDAYRPEDVRGSYAVYCDKQNNKYKNGKLFHIYRPFCFDADGVCTYAELLIEDGYLTITIPQDYLDHCVYPMTLDPTLGATAAGGSNYALAGVLIISNYLVSASSSGTVDRVYAYSTAASQSTDNSVGYYNNSGGVPNSLVTGNVSLTVGVGAAWYYSAVTGDITSGQSFHPSVLFNTGGGTSARFFYDSSSGTRCYLFTGRSSMPTTAPTGGSDTGIMSVYLDYTESSADVSGTVAMSQKKQSTALSGTSQITSAGSLVQKKQSISASGTVEQDYTVSGTLAVNQKKQSAMISGTSEVNYVLIDHTYVSKYTDIPQSYIDTIKTKWFDLPGESHSSGYRNGLSWLEDEDGKFAVAIQDTGTPEGATSDHLRASRASWGDVNNSSGWLYGYGEEDWYTSVLAIARTKAHIQYCHDNSLEIGYIGFGWCWDTTWINDPGGTVDPVFKCRWAGSSSGGPEGNLRWGLDAADQTLTGNSVCMDTYLNATLDFINYCSENAIGTKVFYTTGPVDSYSGENAYQREVKHDYIRNFVTTNGGFLFDYADILCWSNAGVRSTLQWTDGDSTVHTFPNIAPDNLLNFNGSDGSGGTGHIGERGELRLGKAIWVMLAMMEGWDPSEINDVSGTLAITQKKQSIGIIGTSESPIPVAEAAYKAEIYYRSMM